MDEQQRKLGQGGMPQQENKLANLDEFTVKETKPMRILQGKNAGAVDMGNIIDGIPARADFSSGALEGDVVAAARKYQKNGVCGAIAPDSSLYETDSRVLPLSVNPDAKAAILDMQQPDLAVTLRQLINQTPAADRERLAEEQYANWPSVLQDVYKELVTDGSYPTIGAALVAAAQDPFFFRRRLMMKLQNKQPYVQEKSARSLSEFLNQSVDDRQRAKFTYMTPTVSFAQAIIKAFGLEEAITTQLNDMVQQGVASNLADAAEQAMQTPMWLARVAEMNVHNPKTQVAKDMAKRVKDAIEAAPAPDRDYFNAWAQPTNQVVEDMAARIKASAAAPLNEREYLDKWFTPNSQAVKDHADTAMILQPGDKLEGGLKRGEMFLQISRGRHRGPGDPRLREYYMAPLSSIAKTDADLGLDNESDIVDSMVKAFESVTKDPAVEIKGGNGWLTRLPFEAVKMEEGMEGHTALPGEPPVNADWGNRPEPKDEGYKPDVVNPNIDIMAATRNLLK